MEGYMKKTLFRITIVGALILSTHLGYSSNTNVSSLKERGFHFSWPQINEQTKGENAYSPMFALNTAENLKAYHLGLQFLFPNHVIPTGSDMMDAIRSHALFCGFLSQEEGSNLFKNGQHPFLIFEEKDCNDMSHFFVAHPKGLRHFTINSTEMGGKVVLSLNNGNPRNYPKLGYFLECTLSS